MNLIKSLFSITNSENRTTNKVNHKIISKIHTDRNYRPNDSPTDKWQRERKGE
jgi:hypothetical protein